MGTEIRNADVEQAQADLAAQLVKNVSYGDRDELDLAAKQAEAVAELERLESLAPKSKS